MTEAMLKKMFGDGDESRFTMFGDCVLIRPLQTEASKGTLIRQNEVDNTSSHMGTVVSVSDEITPKPNYAYGDTVLFDIFNTERVDYDNVTYYVAHSKDIFAVLGGKTNEKK